MHENRRLRPLAAVATAGRARRRRSLSPAMRAAWYEKNGPAREVIKVGELPDPQSGAGEVRVRIHASGVNPSDVKRRSGNLGQAIRVPRVVPHSDGAGVIDAA